MTSRVRPPACFRDLRRRAQVGGVPIDTGFLVYNENSYPNLIGMFEVREATAARRALPHSRRRDPHHTLRSHPTLRRHATPPIPPPLPPPLLSPNARGQAPPDMPPVSPSSSAAAARQELGVPTEPSNMSFAVSLAKRTFEWSSNGLGGLFATRSNVVSPSFYGMISDILRFNK